MKFTITEFAEAVYLSPDSYYRTFKIPKKKGKSRIIKSPKTELKNYQRFILNCLKKNVKLNPSKYANGFVENKSILDNVLPHIGKRYILKIDIENFFPSITYQQVKAQLRKWGEKKYYDEFAKICTYKGRLPQGAPTSPFLSNLVFRPLDFKLGKIAKKHNASYTRYADDLTFSFNDRKYLPYVLRRVEFTLKKAGFKINKRKTRVCHQNNRMLITGLTCNRKANIPRNRIRKFRAKLHNILKKGDPISKKDYEKLKGYASFVSMINKKKGDFFNAQIDEIVNKCGIKDAKVVKHEVEPVESISIAKGQRGKALNKIEEWLGDLKGNVIGILSYIDKSTAGYLDEIPKSCGIRLITSYIDRSEKTKKRMLATGKDRPYFVIKKISDTHSRWIGSERTYIIDLNTDLKTKAIGNKNYVMKKLRPSDCVSEIKQFKEFYYTNKKKLKSKYGSSFTRSTFIKIENSRHNS